MEDNVNEEKVRKEKEEKDDFLIMTRIRRRRR